MTDDTAAVFGYSIDSFTAMLLQAALDRLERTYLWREVQRFPTPGLYEQAERNLERHRQAIMQGKEDPEQDG